MKQKKVNKLINKNWSSTNSSCCIDFNYLHPVEIMLTEVWILKIPFTLSPVLPNATKEGKKLCFQVIFDCWPNITVERLEWNNSTAYSLICASQIYVAVCFLHNFFFGRCPVVLSIFCVQLLNFESCIQYLKCASFVPLMYLISFWYCLTLLQMTAAQNK